jgi:small GTP-binding protein
VASSRSKISILILGNERVGKTSLCKQLAQNIFQEEYLATIGMDFNKHTILETEAFIWQTSGAERYQAISRAYYRSIDIYLIVLSNEDTNALQNLKNHEGEIHDHGDITKTKIVVVNKHDLTGISDEEKIELNAYCKSKNLPIHYISATSHEEVESVFKSAVLQHLRKTELEKIKFTPLEQKSLSLPQPQKKGFFEDYLKYSCFKLSFLCFGTHHIGRAKAVKAVLEAIENSHTNFNKNEDKLKIIQNQIDLFENKIQTDESLTEAKRLGLNDKWATRLKNNPHRARNIHESYSKPSTLLKGGYYRELVRIKNELEHEIKSEKQQARPLPSSSPRNG